MKPAEQSTEIQALTERIVELLDSVHHQAALSALISVFRATALQFPCCAASAASTCLVVATELSNLPPEGRTTH